MTVRSKEADPTPTPDRLPVVVNREGGSAHVLGDALEDSIRTAFSDAGLAIDLHLVHGHAVSATVSKLGPAPIIAVGGGDGTLGCVARTFARRGTTLGILPLGTRNHLARELGIPLDLPGAAQTIAQGKVRQIDISEVNSVSFVNNASVGFYPLLVRWRDAEHQRHGLPKWLATVPAVWAALGRLRHHRMHLRSQDGERRVRTPLLFVGNNRYLLEPGRIGQRVALDDGLLSVFAVARRSRAGLIWFAFRALTGRADPQRDFTAFGDCRELIVESASNTIDVALDGEVRRLKTPLRFRVAPRTLAVCVPRDGSSTVA